MKKRISARERLRRVLQSSESGFLSGDGETFSMTKVKGGYRIDPPRGRK